MARYEKLISEATGQKDRATLALIEDFMRDGRTGLDGLPLPAFRRLAQQAWEDAQVLAATGELADYCDAVGLPIPEIAR